MPRKQRFKPSRKPKVETNEVGRDTISISNHSNTGDRRDGSDGGRQGEVHSEDAERSY